MAEINIDTNEAIYLQCDIGTYTKGRDWKDQYREDRVQRNLSNEVDGQIWDQFWVETFPLTSLTWSQKQTHVHHFHTHTCG